MLTRVQLEILKVLIRSSKPIGVRKIAELSGCSLAEVWRQVSKLLKLNLLIVKPHGKYRRFKVNLDNPLMKPLLDLIERLDSYGWLMGKDLIQAVSELKNYYVSGVFALKGLIREFMVPSGMLIIVDYKRYERALKVVEWFKGVFKIDVVPRDLTTCLYLKANAVTPYNRAIAEQAIADSAGTFSLDPFNNVEAILLPLYYPVDFNLLSRALEGWGEEAKYRVWLALMIGRVMGRPLPAGMFKPRKTLRDPLFNSLVISRSRKILRPDQMVRVKGW